MYVYYSDCDQSAKRASRVCAIPDCTPLHPLPLALIPRPRSPPFLSEPVPPTRSDVLHPCDIMEDVAIAYGYNNLKWEVPRTVTVAKQQPINCFADLVRGELAQAGFTEVLTWILGSRADNFEMVNRQDDLAKAAQISNAKTFDFEASLKKRSCCLELLSF